MMSNQICTTVIICHMLHSCTWCQHIIHNIPYAVWKLIMKKCYNGRLHHRLAVVPAAEASGLHLESTLFVPCCLFLVVCLFLSFFIYFFLCLLACLLVCWFVSFSSSSSTSLLLWWSSSSSSWLLCSSSSSLLSLVCFLTCSLSSVSLSVHWLLKCCYVCYV